MDFIQRLLLPAALGATAGVFIGTVRWVLQSKKTNTEPEETRQKRASFAAGLMGLLSKGIYIVLALAIIWTLYFMGLGLVDKSQTEYAANAATLIVSFATIFSIFIAYYEFTHRRK